MQRKNPRTDIVSRKPYPKEELIRFSLVNGSLALLSNPGRGFYLCKDGSTLELGLKKKVFDRVLNRPIKEEEIKLLKEALWTKS